MTTVRWPLDRRYRAAELEVRGRRWRWGERTLVMGIVNCTPDSFSGDGVPTAEQARVVAVAMVAAGADLIDVGGESTRPGAEPVPAAEQARRIVPAIGAIRADTDVPISVDTSAAEVADAALDAGADLVNDVRGLAGDPELAAVCARRSTPLVVMHNQRHHPATGDVMTDVVAGLEASLARAAAAGIPDERVLVDPGFGFGWTVDENLELLRGLPGLAALELPILVGTSRKSTLGAVLGDRPVEHRTFATAATVAQAVCAGADLVRVHDVAAAVDVVRTVDRIVRR